MYDTLIQVAITIISILTIFLLYVTIIFSYMGMKKRFAQNKYIFEILTVLFVILISATFKGLVISQIPLSEGEHYNIGTIILNALYSSIGGLQFEGLPYGAESIVNLPLWLQTLYHGSSILAGLVFVTVLSFAISFEFSQWIKLLGILFKSSFKREKHHYYIFTSLTEDSLTLADNIYKHHRTNKQKCVIIFSGSIGGFDKQNDFCRRVFAKGYIYYSLSLTSKNNQLQSIIKHLKLNKRPNVHLFAFNLNEVHFAYEEYNSRIIFKEIESQIQVISEKVLMSYQKNHCDYNPNDIDQLLKVVQKNIGIRNYYYLLANNDENYYAYDRRLREIIVKTFNLDEQTINHPAIKESFKLLMKVFRSRFQIRIVNEADLAAEDLMRQRQRLYAKTVIKISRTCKHLKWRTNIKQFKTTKISAKHFKTIIKLFKNRKTYEYQRRTSISEYLSTNKFEAMFLGFGEKGRSVFQHLFVDTTFIDFSLQAVKFVADIYDQNEDGIAGGFLANHPLIECSNTGRETKGSEKLKSSSLPVVRFNKMSCFSLDFFDKVDEATGYAPKDNCNFINIALGSDQNNIELANAILRDVRNEIIDHRANNKALTKRYQVIAINLRNNDNAHLINWITKEENFPIDVIFYGSSKEMYSYDNIINEDEMKEYDYNYQYISLGMDVPSLVQDVIKDKKDLENTDFIISMLELLRPKNDLKLTFSQYINQYASNVCWDKYRKVNNTLELIQVLEENWYTLDNFKIESNRSANSFKPQIKECIRWLEKSKIDYNKAILYLCALEHERWIRFHIVHGYRYHQERNDNQREHNCLVNYDDMDYNSLVYDFINIIIGNK